MRTQLAIIVKPEDHSGCSKCSQINTVENPIFFVKADTAVKTGQTLVVNCAGCDPSVVAGLEKITHEEFVIRWKTDQEARKNGKMRRGFASMDREKQRQIASQGGKVAHLRGTAHEFTTDEAKDAGRKGGLRVSKNREHMSAIGRAGGKKRGENVRRRLEAAAAAANTGEAQP